MYMRMCFTNIIIPSATTAAINNTDVAHLIMHHKEFVVDNGVDPDSQFVL